MAMKSMLPLSFPATSLCFVILLSPVSLPAQAGSNIYSLSIEQLMQIEVEVASKSPQAVNDAPGIISVITRADIRRYGANTLLDVLQRFPGFVPVSDITFGARGSALRGDTNLNAERLLTLINGQPFLSNINAVHTTRNLYQAYPLQTIERIELIRGPGSSIYGTNAVTGVINIITRKEKQSYVEAELKLGSFSSKQQKLLVQYNEEDLQMSLALDLQSSDGWSSDIENAFMPGMRVAYDKPTEHQSLLGQLRYHGFSLQTLLMDYDSNFVRPLEGIYDDIITAENRFVDVGYDYDFNLDWQLSAHWIYHQGQDSQYDGQESNHLIDIDIKAQINDAGLKFIAGMQLHHGKFEAKSPLVLNFDGTLQSASLFAQFEVPLTPHWVSHIGGQINKVKDGGEDFSPRLGVIYNSDNNRGVKLLYNEAFRSPKAVETQLIILIEGLGPAFVGNPSLQSETVKTLELQWFSYQPSYHYTATLYASRYSNRIEVDPTVFPGTFAQQDTLDIFGLELEGRISLTDNLGLDAYYTHQENKTDGGEKDSTLAPNNTLGLGISYQFNNAVLVSAFNQYVSSFHENKAAVINNPRPSSYNLLNANLYIPIKQLTGRAGLEDASITLYANNLLDEKIWQPELVLSQFNSTQVYAQRSIFLGLQLNW